MLISPLDWGLGHATRSVPLIRAFLSSGCSVTIACSGSVERLLRAEFPEASFIRIRGYNVSYPRNGRLFLFKMLIQLPSILLSVAREHRWLKRNLSIHGWDLVVSDNRYGLHHPNLRSVLVTHQLHIRSGSSRLMDPLIRRLLFKRLSSFDECWVPDVESEPSLSGALSHGVVPDHVRYIGPLSRLSSFGAHPTSGRVLVVLSGPEPQRSLFERIIARQLPLEGQDILVVRGRPGESVAPSSLKGVRWVNHLPSEELAAEMGSAALVVARSGYSTVMDLVRTGRRAVLVPTPGQTEQEYLARHLSDQGWFLTRSQASFDLREAVEMGLASEPPDIQPDFERHMDFVRGILHEGNGSETGPSGGMRRHVG